MPPANEYVGDDGTRVGLSSGLTPDDLGCSTSCHSREGNFACDCGAVYRRRTSDAPHATWCPHPDGCTCDRQLDGLIEAAKPGSRGCGCVCRECLRADGATHQVCIHRCGLARREATHDGIVKSDGAESVAFFQGLNALPGEMRETIRRCEVALKAAVAEAYTRGFAAGKASTR